MSFDLSGTGRSERARIVGSLARRFGDLELAEDAVQEAFAAASIRWPIDGAPDRPGAWLTTTAHRKAIGLLRRRRPTVDLEAVESTAAGRDAIDRVDPSAADPSTAEADGGAPRVSDDDLFTLILTCCHPALSAEARVALTLRHVCGLDVGRIAAAFLTGEAAMAKRLVRSRRKIRDAGIPFARPDGAALEERVHEVRTVIYLVFTEGHLATGADAAIRADLCDEAVWLNRHLAALRPDDETAGLLALLLVQNARRPARERGDGRLVPFAEQSRRSWDTEAIEEARSVLSATSGRAVGRFQVEAAIALLHVADAQPDWARIADLYGVLGRLAPSPIVEVNRALAVGWADGAPAGLAVLDALGNDERLAAYPLHHAARGELLGRLGDRSGAAAAWRRAAALAPNAPQRASFEESAAAAQEARS